MAMVSFALGREQKVKLRYHAAVSREEGGTLSD